MAIALLLTPSCLMTRQLSRPALGGDQLAVDQRFGDLNGVERGALAQVVGNDPHRQPVLHRRVLADAPDERRVLARRLVWRHVTARLVLVDDNAARRIA